jgi:[ribosomal protein S5]-alanine N-acetyltransferase
MSLLRPRTFEAPLVIEGAGLYLKPPHSSDYAAWAELRNRSREHLSPWEPVWPRDDLTKSAYRRRLRHYASEARADLGHAFFIFDAKSDQLIGGITLGNVRRGVTQTATLGYWMGAPYAGKGVMTNAVATILPIAFQSLSLHRLEAAVQPANQPSIRVLEKNGFQKEGLAREYLKINGQWQDHVLLGLLRSDFSATVSGMRP